MPQAKTIVSTSLAAIGPYSQAVRVGDTLYTDRAGRGRVRSNLASGTKDTPVSAY